MGEAPASDSPDSAFVSLGQVGVGRGEKCIAAAPNLPPLDSGFPEGWSAMLPPAAGEQTGYREGAVLKTLSPAGRRQGGD